MSIANEKLKKEKKSCGDKNRFPGKRKNQERQGEIWTLLLFEFFALLMQFCLLEKATFSNENVREAEVFLNQNIYLKKN